MSTGFAKCSFIPASFASAISSSKALADNSLQLPSSPGGWACVGALALLPTALSLTLTTVAIQYIGSTPTAILGVFEPVTAVIFGITVFGETLTERQTVGLVLVLAAVTVVVAGGNLTHQLIRLKKMFPSLRIGKK